MDKPLLENLKLAVFWCIILAAYLIAESTFAQTLDDLPKTRKGHPKLESVLFDLHEEHEKGISAARGFMKKRGMKATEQDKITLYIHATQGKSANSIDKAALKSYDVEIIKSSGSIIQARVPIGMIKEIADTVKGISFIEQPVLPASQYYQTEGLSLVKANTFHSAGFTGSGIKVAVIDTGFANISSTINNGELNTVYVYDCTLAFCTNAQPPWDLFESNGHGTAVAEIIKDIAPNAELYLIKVETTLDLKAAKDFCKQNSIKIVNTSLGYSNTNFYDGSCYSDNPSCTVNDAYQNGIFWVTSNGNYATQHYEATFTDLILTDFHDTVPSLTAYWGDTIKLYLSWDAWPTTNQDYDLALYNSLLQLVASSTNSQSINPQKPVEAISYTVPLFSSGTYYVGIGKWSASSNHWLKIYSVNHSLTPSVSTHSLTSPADAIGAFAVGAIDYPNWTAGTIATYSSQGPATDGRIKPEISAPAAVSTYVYGTNGFSGTSASAPHVAGAAALVLQQYPGLTHCS